jgi:hypothetical protein
MIFIKVDLPEPFLATSAILSPSSILMVMFLKSVLIPKDLEMFSTEA